MSRVHRPAAPSPLVGTTRVVTLVRMVPGGVALASDDDGITFVRGALPGERARVRIDRVHKQVRHATVIEVIEPSADRAKPDCALHPRCGGCDFLDATAAAQARYKHTMVVDALVRIARIDATTVARVVRPIAAPQRIDRTDTGRRRARFISDARGTLTFSLRGAHQRVAVSACVALHPALDAAVARVNACGVDAGVQLRLATDDRGHVSAATASTTAAERLMNAGAVSGVCVLQGDDVVSTLGDVVLRGEVACETPHYSFESDAAVFTQACRFGGREILRHVVDAVAPSPGRSVLELFAGSGHLTLPLALAGCLVHAVEGSARASMYLDKNLARTQHQVSTERAFIDGALVLPPHDVMVVDPPRVGVPDFARILHNSSARKLVMVSCDLATGARDIALAVRAGFTLSRVQPIDAFARTSHVETVALLQRGQTIDSGGV